MVPIVDKFDPAYVEEMRGIAEGAGCAFAGIMLMNARTEMVCGGASSMCSSIFPTAARPRWRCPRRALTASNT